MNRDKRGGRVGERDEGMAGGKVVGNGQMFSSSPTSTDPLLFNAGTLRMSTGKTERRGRGTVRREDSPRKGKHC